jgi:hypothetical protein
VWLKDVQQEQALPEKIFTSFYRWYLCGLHLILKPQFLNQCLDKPSDSLLT